MNDFFKPVPSSSNNPTGDRSSSPTLETVAGSRPSAGPAAMGASPFARHVGRNLRSVNGQVDGDVTMAPRDGVLVGGPFVRQGLDPSSTPDVERARPPSSSMSARKRPVSMESSSSLSSVPPSPPRTRSKGKARVVEASDNDDGEQDEPLGPLRTVNKQSFRPALRARSGSPGVERFVGVTIPRVPAGLRNPRKPSPDNHRPPASDSDDDLEDADDVMDRVMLATRDSPKRSGKRVAFEEDSNVRRSERVMDRGNRTAEERERASAPRLTPLFITTADKGKYSLSNLLKTTRNAERLNKAVEQAAAIDLPDELPDHLLSSSSKATRVAREKTPPINGEEPSLSQSPSKTRIEDIELASLEERVQSIIPRATSEERRERNHVQKTVQMIRSDAAGNQMAELAARREREARNVWRWSESGRVAKLVLPTDGPAGQQEILEAVRAGLADWALFPVDLFLFTSDPIPASSLELLLKVALHPTAEPRLGDRILQAVCTTPSSPEASEAVQSALAALLKGLGMQSGTVAVNMEVEAGPNPSEEVTAGQRGVVIRRAMRFVDWASASSTNDGTSFASQRTDYPASGLGGGPLHTWSLELALDPTSNGATRPALVKTIQNLVSPRLNSWDADWAMRLYMNVESRLGWQGKRELLRLVPTYTSEGQALRSWLALAMLRPELTFRQSKPIPSTAPSEGTEVDFLTRPPLSLIYHALCEPLADPCSPSTAKQRPDDAPSGTSTPAPFSSPELPRFSVRDFRPAFDVNKTGSKDCVFAVAILATAIRDVGAYVDIDQATGRKHLKEGCEAWLKALRTSLQALDSSIRISLRGDPERSKLKNAVTRLHHAIYYQLASVKSSHLPAVQPFPVVAEVAGQTKRIRPIPSVKSREGTVSMDTTPSLTRANSHAPGTTVAMEQ